MSSSHTDNLNKERKQGVRREGKERKEEKAGKTEALGLLKSQVQERRVKEHQRQEGNQDIAEETNKMNLGDRR